MQTLAPACPRANAIERPIPELAPVTIAFCPLSNLRFSVLGATGFGRSPKVCACGIFGFGRLIASGGMVGIGIPFLFCGFVVVTSDSLQTAVVCAVLSALLGPRVRISRAQRPIDMSNGNFDF